MSPKPLELAEHFLSIDKPERALEELSSVNEFSYMFWYLSARAKFVLGQFKEAKAALEEGLKEKPDDLYLLYLLVQCERKLRVVEKYKAFADIAVVKTITRLRALFPERADVAELHAMVLLDLNKYDAMYKVFAEAKRLRGENPNSLLNATVALMFGKEDVAIKHIATALADDPENARTHSIAANAYKKAWQLPAAAYHAEIAAKLEPTNPFYRRQVRNAEIRAHPLYKPIEVIVSFNYRFKTKPALFLLGFLLIGSVTALITEQLWLMWLSTFVSMGPFVFLGTYGFVIAIVLNIYLAQKKRGA